jgi:hypothetical protein
MNTRKPEKSAQTAAGTAADQVRVADQSFATNVSQEVGIDDVGSLIQKIRVTPTAEFEKLIGELQEARSYLESEGERIQREAVGYAEFSQAASSSLKDTRKPWPNGAKQVILCATPTTADCEA